jgi:hypothetical protein
LYRGRPRIPSYSSPTATSISSHMVSSLLQISDDGCGSDVFFRRSGQEVSCALSHSIWDGAFGCPHGWVVRLRWRVTPSPMAALASKRLLMVIPWTACLDLVLGCCLRWCAVVLEFYPCGGQRGGGRWAFTIADASLEVMGASSCGIFQVLVLPIAAAVD